MDNLDDGCEVNLLLTSETNVSPVFPSSCLCEGARYSSGSLGARVQSDSGEDDRESSKTGETFTHIGPLLWARIGVVLQRAVVR